jgi:hypothetical protein
MNIDLEIIALGTTVVSAVVWLVRLEGRVNAADKAVQTLKAETDKAVNGINGDLIGVKVRADNESAEHRRTSEALIRLEEQMKYVRELLERHFVEPEKPRRRTPP